MNTCQTLELAIRESLAQYAGEAIPVSWLHCAFTPTDEDNGTGRVAYPQLLITVGGKAQDESGTQWDSVVTLTCATLSEQDCDGHNLAAMYEAAEEFFEHLLHGDELDERVAHFQGVVRRTIPTFCLGGFTPEATDGATVQEGLRIAQFAGVLHYGY